METVVPAPERKGFPAAAANSCGFSPWAVLTKSPPWGTRGAAEGARCPGSEG